MDRLSSLGWSADPTSFRKASLSDLTLCLFTSEFTCSLAIRNLSSQEKQTVSARMVLDSHSLRRSDYIVSDLRLKVVAFPDKFGKPSDALLQVEG